MNGRPFERERLLFGVRLSSRYHDRRTAHFDFLHRVTDVSTILMAGVVLTELLGAESSEGIKVLATVSAIFVAIDLVVGYSRSANSHRDFKRRFIALERRMLLHPDEPIAIFRDCRLEIEADEPPVFRALATLCHNEVLTSEGRSKIDPNDVQEFKPITRWQRTTANWLKWPNIAT